MTCLHPVRDDFPREPAPGLMPAAQPRLLVRKMDKRYRIGLTDEAGAITRQPVMKGHASHSRGGTGNGAETAGRPREAVQATR